MKKSILTLITVLLAGLSTAWGQNVAKIGDTPYPTLTAAFAAAQNGDVVELLDNYDATSEAMSGGTRQFVINKSITFDGKGHTLTTKQRGFGVGNVNNDLTSEIDVTFKDVTIQNSSSAARCIDTRGMINSLTLNNVILKTDGATSGYTQPLTIGGNQSTAATINITNSTIQTNDAATAYYAIITFNPVNMTIDNSTIKGWACIYAKGPDGSAGSAGSVINIQNDSKLFSKNVYSGDTNAFGAIVFEDDDVTVNITGSEVNVESTGDQYQAVVSYAPGSDGTDKVDINDSEITLTGDNTTYVVKSESSVTPDVTLGEGTTSNKDIPDNYIDTSSSVVIYNGVDTYTVGTIDDAVAQIGDKYYATLDAAFAAVQDGETIKLLADITLTDRLFVNAGATPAYDSANKRYATTSDNKSITLELDGHNITSSSNIALAGGSLNITNTGTADDTHGVISTTTAGLAPIEVRGTGALANKRTLTIGENVTLSGSTYGLNVFGSNDAQKNTIDVTVNGTVKGILFVLGNLKNADNAINIVVNGTVDASNATVGDGAKTGIALNGNANVTVNSGATVTGETGIEVRAGQLTVNGGTITGTADTFSYTDNGNGTTTKGAAIAVAQHTTVLPIAVTLNGGTLVGKELIGVTDVNGDMSSVSVTAAASFVENTETKLPTGYVWAPTTGNKYTIAPAVVSVTAGDVTTYYYTLNEAIQNVTDGATVTFLQNVTITSSITCPLEGEKSFTIAFNGKSLNRGNYTINLHAGVTAFTDLGFSVYTTNANARLGGFRAAETTSRLVWMSRNNKHAYKSIALTSVEYVAKDGTTKTADAINITNTQAEYLRLEGQYYFIEPGSTFTMSGDFYYISDASAKLILTDGSTLSCSRVMGAGNDKEGRLTVFGQTEQTGKFRITSQATRGLHLLYYTQNGGDVVATKSCIDAKFIEINRGSVTTSAPQGGTPTIGRNSDEATVTINGGIVNAKNTSTGNAIQAGTVTITGGQVTATGHADHYGIRANTINMGLTEPDGFAPSDEFILVSKYHGTVNIYGTDDTLYDAETNVPYSGQPVADISVLAGRKLVVGLTVAVIGEKKFKSLQKAVDYISNDGMPRTIQLVNDIEEQTQVVIPQSNKKITIDMNGHTIKAVETEPFKVTGNNVDLTFTGTGEIICKDDDNSVAMLGENGHLTINGGVTITEGTVFVSGKNNVVDINGKINVTGEQAAIQTNGNDTNTGNVINVNDPAEVTSATDNAIYAAGDANYNINGGSVTGATAIYVKSGKLTVTDGTITGTGDGIVIDNANYPNGSPEVSIKGGTIKSTGDGKAPVASYSPDNTPRITGFISAGTYNKNNVEADLLAQGYVMQPDGNGMYTPVPGAGVAKIGDVYYATLDAAIAAVPTTSVETKIELLTNINATKRTVIPSNTNIVLDLGGYTLRCDEDFTIADFEGTAASPTSTTANAKLTIQNGTVTSKEKYAIRLGGNGNTVTIAEDAVVKAGANTDYAVVLRGENNTFIINGTVEVAHGTAISTNGSDATNNNAIVINEPAKISSPDDNAIYMPSGSLTVNGGTITGKTGIYFKSKNLTIPATSTAVITGTGEQRAAHYNGNGGDWTGDALVVDNANYPAGDPLANIQGGTFVSANALPIASYATGSSATAATKFVSGGKFSEQIPVAVIAEGFICPSEPNVDSYYMLIEGSYEAEVDGMGYETFAKAVEAADEGDVITLLNNVAEPYTMQEGQTLKVAKNGKTITMQTPSDDYSIDETTEGDVTTYILRKRMRALTFPTNIESYFTGEAQDVPLVITDGDYTLVPGVDYKFVEGDNVTNDFKKTNVGTYTFEVKGYGKYVSRQTVHWTILKSLNYETITITINPAIYNGSQKDPKDFITVKDGNTTLVAGTDYKIVTKAGPFTDAKAYIDAVSIIGLKAADKFIGDTIVTDFIINPMDVKDYSVSASVLYRSQGYTVDKANNKDEVKNASSYVLTFKDMSGNTVDVANYTVTIADGFYRDVQRYDYTVIVTPIGDNTNVTGRLVGPLYINPGDAIDISQCLVTSKAVYNSRNLPPSKGRLEITYTNPTTQEKRTLVKDQDYELSFQGQVSDYVNAKTYSNAVTLKGIGDFYGELTTDYVIEPCDLSDKYVRADVMAPLQWTGQVQKLNVNHQISGRDDNNVNLYLIYDGSVNVNVTPNEVVDNGHYELLTANNDYVLTTVPADIKEPGEYQVTFSGRYNFKGQKTIKVMLLKDISQLTDEDVQVPLQIIKGSLYPSNMQDVVVKDGDKELERGTHYSLKIRYADGTTECTNGNTNPVTQDGVYTAVFTGLEPYYSKSKEVEFIAAYEYYAAGNQQIDHNDAGIHLTSGKDLEAQIGAKTGIAVDATKIGVTIYNQVTLTVPDGADGREVVLSVVGIDDNAFAGENNLHYVDASELADYVPSSLSRTSDSPFNGIAKQALVFLNGYNIHGENYVYKVADNDFRCEELKIYEDTQGDQLGFTDNDYKWTFINPRPFLAQTLTNTRVLTAGKHYTTCLPYSIPQVDFKAYTLDASSSNLLGFKEVAGSLEALTPYVVIPEETGKLFSATEVTIPVTGRITDNQFAPFSDEEMAKFGNTVAPTVGGHQLLGTLRYMDKNEAAGMYIMQADKKWKKVGDATSTYNGPCILPMRAYIGEPAAVTPGGSRTIGAEFTNIDGTVISLDDVKFNEDDNVYDLQGRRVETPRKGNVYIINGKKQQWR